MSADENSRAHAGAFGIGFLQHRIDLDALELRQVIEARVASCADLEALSSDVRQDRGHLTDSARKKKRTVCQVDRQAMPNCFRRSDAWLMAPQ